MSRLSTTLSRIFGSRERVAKPVETTELGMTVKSEQAFCQEYARDLYTGAGEIADLGCWMGATTISFSRGLSGNDAVPQEKRKKRIHSYDLFRWHPTMDCEVEGSPIEGKYREGDDFFPDFEMRTAPWTEYFTVRRGDLNDFPWTGGPIEMLFVDAMKWPSTAATIVQRFYPHLIPGVSLVAHQDFAHFYTGWIHLIQYRLRDYFEVFRDVERSATVVFRLTKPIPPELLTQDCFLEHTDLEEIAAAFDYSASLVCPDKEERIAATRAMAHLHRGEPDLAEQVMNAFVWANIAQYRFRKQRPDMIDVRREFEERKAQR